MDIDALKLLISKGESQTLEFKTSTSQLEPALETICGFLNGHGGTVLIGVTDRGKIIGQSVTDDTRKEIAREVNKIAPPINLSTIYVPLGNDKEVIVLKAHHESTYSPYVFDCRPFQRNQSITSRMPQHQYEQLLVKRGHLNYAWDELYSTGYEINDLDHEEIRKTIHLGVSANRISLEGKSDDIEDILRKLSLLRDDHLTNAAITLFAKKVRPNYPQCHIKMARFKGVTKLDEFLDNRSLYGNAFTILAEASLFIQRHLSIASFFQEDSFVRFDRPDLPVLAVREALINAICHRDYADRSSTISLAIYDDRLEIWSFGKLPSDLKIEDLKIVHESRQRNKLICDIIYKRGLVEKWGTGILKMIRLCKEHNIPEPELNQYTGGFSVTFRYKNVQEPTKENISVLSIDKLNLRQAQIVNLLKEKGPLSPRDIMSKLDEPIPERTLRLDLTTLKDMGYLDKTGQAWSTVWFYRSFDET